MTGPALFLAGIRIRRRWKSYLGVAVLLGLTAGLAILSIAGARRTQSAYPRYLRSANASTFVVTTLGNYDESTNATIAAFPEVLQSRTYVGLNLSILDDSGKPLKIQAYEPSGTFDGRFIDQDRFTPLQGRLADRTRLDEMVVNEQAAKTNHLHLGQRLDVGLYSFEQFTAPDFSVNPPVPKMRVTATIVGIGLLNEEVVQDDADRDERLLVTPALTVAAREYVNYAVQGLVLRRGDLDIPAVEKRLESIAPSGAVAFRTTSVDVFHALQAVRPLSIALAIFGLIAGLAGLVLVAQAINRLLRADRSEDASLHAFGARPATIAGATMCGPVICVIAGIIIAVAFAVIASPVMPIGPVRRVEVHRGFDVDGAVLGWGVMLVVFVLAAATAVSAWRQRPQRRLRRHRLRPSRLGGAAAAAGLSPQAVVGLTAAGSAPTDTDEFPTRSVVIGSIIAIAALVGSLTFSASLSALIAKPPLYGWNWDAAISAGNAYGNLDVATSHQILDGDPRVATWWGAYFGAGSINGRGVPLLGAYESAPFATSILRGRSLKAADEIVLGATTAHQLHVDVGDSVSFVGSGAATPLRVVGIATLPTIGKVHTAHTSLGVGAIVDRDLVPGSDLDITASHHGDFGPNMIFVRFRPGTNGRAEIQHLRQTTAPLGSFAGLDVLPVQRPAEIVNATAIGSAPILLGVSLMLASMVSLTLAMGASARQRRRELAILRTLGFSSRQLVGTLSWQATGLITAGLIAGIPLGTVVGRDLWDVFAHQLNVVSRPDLPVVWIVVLIAAVLLVANAAAVLYGRGVRRLNPGEALRSHG
jgi:MacB-like periplasmic core domain/FtsX-like permease family